MPEKRTVAHAGKAERAGKAAPTQAAKFVREEIGHVRRGKHGARSIKPAIAIGREVASSLAEERKQADETLRQERARGDQALAEERDRTDEAPQERKDRERLLGIVRRSTDGHLETNRQHTDDAIDDAVSLFSQEQKAHSRARAVVVTRDEFLAIVSHDLRAPLTAIALGAAVVRISGWPVQGARQLRSKL